MVDSYEKKVLLILALCLGNQSSIGKLIEELDYSINRIEFSLMFEPAIESDESDGDECKDSVVHSLLSSFGGL